MNNNYQQIKEFISSIEKYQIKSGDKISINYKILNEDINNIDKDLISSLLKNELCKELFFNKVEDVYVFNQNSFIEVIFNTNEYMEGSYTKYENKIGLFLKDEDTIQLNFPYKDCVLVGGMDKEDDKVNLEIFYNEILEKDKINKLFEPKVFHNLKKYSYKKDLAENEELDNPLNIQVEENVDNVEFETIIVKEGTEKEKLKDNLLIKGNNLLGLHSLAKRLSGTIDVIYIDPPYYFNEAKSTDSFAYNSNFKLSSWLTFMKNRLEIARELLADTGVIFISMNEDGNSYLKILCDEVFGIDNFVSNICWNKQNSQNDAEYFQNNKENILVYKINKTFLKIKTNKEIDVISMNGKFYIKKGGITKGSEDGYLNNSITLGYSIYYNEKTNEIIPLMDYDKEIAKISNNYEEIYKHENKELLNKGFICIRPPLSNGRIKRWTWGFKKMQKDNHLILIKKNKNGYNITTLEEINKENIKNNKIKFEKLSPSKNIIDFSSSNGTKVLNQLFKNRKIFGNSKPFELIKYIISLYQSKNAIILDFFAGSGTTAHATLALNKEDGGNRKFILLEQMDYIENITAERIKRAMIKEEYEDSFIYMEMMESEVKEIKNSIKSLTTKEELISLINDNFDKGYFININNKEQLLLKIENIYSKATKKSNPLNDSVKLVIEKHMDNNVDYISYEDIEEFKKYMRENEYNLNKSFYEGY